MPNDDDFVSTKSLKAEGVLVLYIRVTWPWIIIPITETLATVMLLVYCIVLSNHIRLMETSLIALLVHGLDGYAADEIVLPDSEDAEKPEMVVGGMRAKFIKDDQGQLRFFMA